MILSQGCVSSCYTATLWRSEVLRP
uniref:Uncharacterized protein n=1 Tax=Anguilla anguilla TaxID=7936 RepID=A0A0E9PYW2_ANGAN